MQTKQNVVVATVWISLCACATVKHARVDELYRKSGLERASFELQCPASELTVTTLSAEQEREYRLLGDDEPFPVKGDTVGVRGCGRDAVYVFSGSTGWLNNTGVQTKQK